MTVQRNDDPDDADDGLPRKKEVGARMRRARENAKLTQREAAARMGVEQSTVHRWEKGKLSPREHWVDVQREYGVTRLAIEYGIGVAVDSEPPYVAWGGFLDWLESAADRPVEVAPWMLEWLRAQRFPAGSEPSVKTYQNLLRGLFENKAANGSQ